MQTESGPNEVKIFCHGNVKRGQKYPIFDCLGLKMVEVSVFEFLFIGIRTIYKL